MQLIKEIDFGTPPSKAARLVTLTIDGFPVTVPEGTSIMRAAMAAGIKVPKGLRKSRVLRSLLASRLGRQVVADAIVAGAGAGAAVLVGERREIAAGAKAGARKGGRGLAVASEAVESAASAMMDVVAEAARSMLPECEPR